MYTGNKLAFAVMISLACATHTHGAFAQAVPPAAAGQDAELAAMLRKKSAYVVLYNDTGRVADSWARYRSWVNLKRGPTGKERIIYGLYSVDAERIAKAGAAAGKLTGEDPKIEALDAAVRAYLPLLDPVVPVINAASAYYDRQDYRDDGARMARQYHTKLLELMPPIIEARAAIARELDTLSDVLDVREIDNIEKVDGKRYRWHARRVLSSARKLSNFIDINLKKPALPALDRAIAEYAATVRDFDAYVAQPGAQHGIMESQPRSFLSKMREMRDEVARGQRPGGIMGTTFIASDYNSLINNFGRGPIR